jgi:hypothetical protein
MYPDGMARFRWSWSVWHVSILFFVPKFLKLTPLLAEHTSSAVCLFCLEELEHSPWETFPTVDFTTFGESSLVATHSRNLACAAINNCYSWYTDNYCKGSFWFTFGAALVPSYGVFATYAKDPTRAPQDGLADRSHSSSAPRDCCASSTLLPPSAQIWCSSYSCFLCRSRLPRGSILAHFIQRRSRKEACGHFDGPWCAI